MGMAISNTNKEVGYCLFKKERKYISTDIKGNILEENVSEKLIDEKIRIFIKQPIKPSR